MHGLILTLWMIMAMREHDAAGRRRRFSALQLLQTSLFFGEACFSGSAGFEQTFRVSIRHAFVPNTCCKLVISLFLIQHLKLLLSPWWEFEALCSCLPSVRFSLSSEKVDKRIFKHLNVIFLLKTIKAAINSTYHLVIEMKGSNFSYLSCTCSFFHWTLHLLRANSPTEHS